MSKYIPLIHDYCDRWCDRCAFRPNCGYIQGKLEITENSESVKMLAWENRQYGLEMDQKALDLMGPELVSRIERFVESDELVIAATEFKNIMQVLLEDFAYWVHMAQDQAKQTASGLRDGREVLAEVREMDKCRDLLCWDFIFIGAKVRRAVAGKLINENEIQSDSNGSAKVAMISISRALNALKKIFEIRPDEDRFFTPLSLLTKIDKMMKQRFPDADKFIRPGFDTDTPPAPVPMQSAALHLN